MSGRQKIPHNLWRKNSIDTGNSFLTKQVTNLMAGFYESYLTFFGVLTTILTFLDFVTIFLADFIY
jgi:hypothetical protein